MLTANLRAALYQVCTEKDQKEAIASIKFFQDAGLDLTVPLADNRSALRVAVEHGNYETALKIQSCSNFPHDISQILDILQKDVERAADPSRMSLVDKLSEALKPKKDVITEKALFIALAEITSPKVFERALRAALDDGYNIECVNDFGNTLLVKLMINRKYDLAKILVENGANLSATCRSDSAFGMTGLRGLRVREIAEAGRRETTTPKLLQDLDKLLPLLREPKIEIIVGRKIYANGDVFEGKFVDSKPTEGTLTMKNGQIFTGLFVGDKPSQGSINLPNGVLFTGTFVNGKPHKGTIAIDGNDVNVVMTSSGDFGVSV